MKTLQKLQQARKKIKETKIKKEGRNDFSKYDYFTPSQISQLVHAVTEELQLFNKFDLKRTALGLTATLEVHDLETESEPVIFEIATDIPEIKATNIAQQLGGCVTYSERYLLQIAYDIVDNNLDFDSKNNKKKVEPKPQAEPKTQAKDKPVLNPESDKWQDGINYLRSGNSTDLIKEKYEITAKHLEDLVFASTL